MTKKRTDNGKDNSNSRSLRDDKKRTNKKDRQTKGDALLPKSEDSCERDANPCGTVIEFVEQLVEGLLEEIGIE
jgi:hypothetical protein